MAREYTVRMGAYDIGKWEFREVEALARRYRDMKRRADVLEKCKAPGIHGEEYAAMKWECSLVEQAAHEVAEKRRRPGGRCTWETALIRACCDGVVYEDIDPADMPTSNRNEFYEARREFFFRLWVLRQKQLGMVVMKTERPDECNA